MSDIIHGDPALFAEAELYAYLAARTKEALEAVRTFEGSQLLGGPFDDAVTTLFDRFRVDPLELREGEVTTDQQETQIATRLLRDGRWRYGDHQPNIGATLVRFFVPFQGHADLFRLSPNSFSLNPPRGKISGSDLVLAYACVTVDGQALRANFDRDLAGSRQCIQSQRPQVEDYNHRLKTDLAEKLKARKDQLLSAANTVAALGFPLRSRAGMPTTFVAPEVRRKVRPSPPTASPAAPFRPEPTLDVRNYEHILSVLENMAVVLERSPSAFKTMKEEDLRQHFLVQLNGQFEGAATGETFNVEGKTDILIRVDGRNIFIAECKFWAGPTVFTATIDQLLGYTSWRDTKTAIVVFNRDTRMSTVLEKIPQLLAAHPNFKRDLPSSTEGRFAAAFSHKGDPSRELLLTVLVFDVPG
jgi:hypothetical protein